MAERLSNLGYLAMIKEATKGTALTPTVYVPLYEESLNSDVNYDEDTPIMGNKADTFRLLQGQRSHSGDLKILAEPNTAARFIDMLLTKGVTSGGGPYTHPFTLSTTTNPNAYTIDIAKGQVVFRYMGVEANEISPSFDGDKMLLNVKVAALKSFTVREISTITGTGPYTITFKTNYDPSPTKGLVVADIIRVYKADGTTIDAAVATIASDTAITCVADVSTAADGDLVALRPATPSFTTVTPFLWARTEFRFGATAAAALSAAQTRLETGSAWTLKHDIDGKGGAMRSGAFDPAALPRLKGGGELSAKIFFDTPEEFNRFATIAKRACVVRHFSETGYELRITFNNLKAAEDPVKVKEGEILYNEVKYKATYDTSDGQNMDVSVINNVATI